MTLITNELCIPVRASTIPVLLLATHRSAQYQISQSLLLQLLILAIRLQRKLKRREGGIIGHLVVTAIGGYLMETYVLRGVSVTAMAVPFGLVGGPTTVIRMAVTALHHIINPLLLTVDMFVLVVFIMFSV